MSKLSDMNTPIYWAEGHPGSLDRDSWTLELSGACEEPRTFTWQDLQSLPISTVEGRLTSVTRWSVFGRWTGIRLSDLLKEVKMKDSCKYLRFWSQRLIYDTSIPLKTALREKLLIAWAFDDELLDENYGGPLRGFIPYLWGYKSAKCVVKIELMEHYIPGYWELRGYTDSGDIEAGHCVDINAGSELKVISGGDEVIDFVKVNER